MLHSDIKESYTVNELCKMVGGDAADVEVLFMTLVDFGLAYPFPEFTPHPEDPDGLWDAHGRVLPKDGAFVEGFDGNLEYQGSTDYHGDGVTCTRAIYPNEVINMGWVFPLHAVYNTAIEERARAWSELTKFQANATRVANDARNVLAIICRELIEHEGDGTVPTAARRAEIRNQLEHVFIQLAEMVPPIVRKEMNEMLYGED